MEYDVTTIIKWTDPDEFDRAFFKLLNQEPQLTHQDAFDRLNDAWRSVFQRDRYSNFDSYRISKHQRMRTKR